MSSIDISIGLLSYQRTDLLKETISSFINTEFVIELVLLNNNEWCIFDEIHDFIKDYKNIELNYLHYKKNLGVSSGRRAIVDNCSSQFLLILDDDICVDDFDSLVSNVLKEFNSNPLLGAIAFNITEYQTGNSNRYEIPHKNKNVDLSSDFDTYLIIGAGNALRVSSVREVGNFADDFGLYGFEEIDVAFRLIANGYSIKYKADCKIRHKKSPDGRFSGDLVNQLYFVNRTRMAKRYLKNRYYISCLVVRFLYLLAKTRNIKLSFSSLIIVLSDNSPRKFDNVFYTYIKKVDGFLWY